MDDYLANETWDPIYGDGTAGDVGPQSNGTYDAPSAAQPSNKPWDTPGGVLGNYTGVVDVLKTGIGAWSQYQKNQQMIDYNRYEATNGGIFRQGKPTGQVTANGSVTVRGNNNALLLLLVVGFFLLKK